MSARGGSAGPSHAPALEDWHADFSRAIPELQILRRRAKTPLDVIISRASQMDAGRLDTELSSMLLEQFLKAFSLVQPKYLNVLRPELSFLLDFLIFWFSVWKGHPTPGSVLMNLRYRDESSSSASGGRTGVEGPGLSLKQRVGWCLGFVLSKYIWERLESVATAWHWGDQADGTAEQRSWRIMQRAETVYRLASLANFIAFLRYGRYRTVMERLLQSRLVYKRASMPKALNFEYLNRQLVWHEVSELLLFLLPLINVTRIKAFLTKAMPRMTQQQDPSTAGPQAVARKPKQCNICMRQEIAVPYVARPCQHLFCYYCLRSHTEYEAGFKCPVCSSIITAMQQWTPSLDTTSV